MKYCPECNKAVDEKENNISFPFCSERCRMIDLGDWLSENHKIPLDDTEHLIDNSSKDDFLKH